MIASIYYFAYWLLTETSINDDYYQIPPYRVNNRKRYKDKFGNKLYKPPDEF